MRSGRLLVTLVVVGCAADAPAAITVGPVAFTENQVLGLTDSRRESLALVTAFGLAVADSSTAALGAPRVEEWTDDRLLEVLAAELTLDELAVEGSALMDAYRADPQWELSVQHILVYSERWRERSHREAAEVKAGRALELLEDGLDFPEVEASLAEEEGAQARAGVLLPEARSTVARRVARTLGSPAATLEAWMARAGASHDARRAAALTEAHARGLEVPPGERAEMLRRWEDQVAAWAPALGFAYGLTPGQVAEAALSALAKTGQSADLARRDLVEHADLMRARYEIDLGTDGGAQP
ncbi:MAG TPA: hypothetical protein VM198_04395 [Longimicrobiales bacterium]|nr:hypothetical protein [Longimicrobiales bacterium]